MHGSMHAPFGGLEPGETDLLSARDNAREGLQQRTAVLLLHGDPYLMPQEPAKAPPANGDPHSGVA